MSNTSKIAFRVSCREPGWSAKALESLQELGFAIVESVVSEEFCKEALKRILEIKNNTTDTLQRKSLISNGEELPFVHLLMHYDPFFYSLINLPELVEIAEKYVGKSVILRNQFAQFVASYELEHKDRRVFHSFHRNFRLLESTPQISLETTMLLADMTEKNGMLGIIPSSHKLCSKPSETYLSRNELTLTASAGSVFFLDGMTWHREHDNRTNQALPLLSQQYTKPMIRQYFDYPALLDPEKLKELPTGTLKLLGCFNRLPESLEEFCLPPENRAFRRRSIEHIEN